MAPDHRRVTGTAAWAFWASEESVSGRCRRPTRHHKCKAMVTLTLRVYHNLEMIWLHSCNDPKVRQISVLPQKPHEKGPQNPAPESAFIALRSMGPSVVDK